MFSMEKCNGSGQRVIVILNHGEIVGVTQATEVLTDIALALDWDEMQVFNLIESENDF